jgi:hypothetical protein
MASSGSRVGSTPNSNCEVPAPPAAPGTPPGTAAARSSGMPRSPARIGELRIMEERRCGPGGTAR